MGNPENTLAALTPPQEEIVRFLKNGAELVKTNDVPARYGFRFAEHLRQVSATSVLALVRGGWLEADRVRYRLTARGLAQIAPQKEIAAV